MAAMLNEDLVRQLIATLADEPRWIDLRGMLLTGHAQVTGRSHPETGDLDDHGFVVKVLHGAMSTIAVIGRPPRESLLAAISGVTDMTPVVAQTADAEWVGQCLAAASPVGAATDPNAARWRAERAIVHRLRSGAGSLCTPSDRPGVIDVRLLSPDDSLSHLPAGLRHEITHASGFAPVAVVLEGGTPVSFCYPVWRTETLWDVSIDTLEGYRGRGLAIHAVSAMIDHMRRDGREPVWCALESNTASLRLAAKRGFAPTDEIVVFSRGSWVILSAGFTG